MTTSKTKKNSAHILKFRRKTTLHSLRHVFEALKDKHNLKLRKIENNRRMFINRMNKKGKTFLKKNFQIYSRYT